MQAWNVAFWSAVCVCMCVCLRVDILRVYASVHAYVSPWGDSWSFSTMSVLLHDHRPVRNMGRWHFACCAPPTGLLAMPSVLGKVRSWAGKPLSHHMA